MKLHWRALEAGDERGNTKNAGNIGNSGNTPRKIGVSCVTATGNRLVTPVTSPHDGGHSVTAVTGALPTPVTQKCRENGSVTTVTAVTAENGVTERKRLPEPEKLATWGEYLLERAAIVENDGGVPRAEADRRAWRELLARYPEAAAHFAPGGGYA